MPKPLPSPEMLRKLLRYEPDTGKLFWRERTVDMFFHNDRGASWACSNWNSKHAGKEAFTAYNGDGYKNGCIFGNKYRAHRVIWAIFYGEWPRLDIDHINGVKTDNRIINLRSVSHFENSRNKTMQKNNSSGVMGVSWHKTRKRWSANIRVYGKLKNLGYFESKDDAILARKLAEVEYGFHKNHGKPMQA